MMIEIIGEQEYQDFLEETSFMLKGTELHYFHPQFVKLMRDLHLEAYFLDELESFSDLPEDQGIYFCVRDKLIARDREVWYVGKAGNFRSRWRNHHKIEALRTIKDIWIYFLPLNDVPKQDIDQAERIYIQMLQPVFNNTSRPEKHLRVAS